MFREKVQALMNAWKDLEAGEFRSGAHVRSALREIVQLFVHKDPPEEAYEAFKQAVLLNTKVLETENDQLLVACREQYERFIGLIPDEFVHDSP